MASVKAGDLDGAISLFQRIGDGGGKCSSLARYYTALCFLRQGLSQPAVSQLGKVRFDEDFQDRSEVLDLLYRMGDQLEKSGLTDSALNLYFKVLERDINFRDVKARIDTISSGGGRPGTEPPLREAPAPAGEIKGIPQRYEIISEMGRGGMGVVYRALDTVLNHEVALKIMAAGIAADGECRERFLNEARAALRLTHPSIVRTYNAELADGVPFITMELVRGRTLRDLIREKGALGLDEASRILEGVASAVDYAHSAGVIHRDLKPDNIMISDEGIVKVMDFGLAKAAEIPSFTADGASMGTPAYMSPEQVRGESATRASDLYSLGITAYEMLTGERPFKGRDTGYQHVHVQPPLPSEINADLSDRVDAAVMAAMQKNPADRLSSATELARALSGDSDLDLLATKVSTPGHGGNGTTSASRLSRAVSPAAGRRARPEKTGEVPREPHGEREKGFFDRPGRKAWVLAFLLLVFILSRPGPRRALIRRISPDRASDRVVAASTDLSDLFKGTVSSAGGAFRVGYDFSNPDQARDFEVALGPFHFFLPDWPSSGSGGLSKRPGQSLVVPGVYTGDSSLQARFETGPGDVWVTLGVADGKNFRKVHHFVTTGKALKCGTDAFRSLGPDAGNALGGVTPLGGRPGEHELGLEFQGNRLFYRDGDERVQVPLDLSDLEGSILFTLNFGGPVRLKHVGTMGTLRPEDWKRRLERRSKGGDPPPGLLDPATPIEQRIDFARNTPSPGWAAEALLSLVRDEREFRSLQQHVRQFAMICALTGGGEKLIPRLRETIEAKGPIAARRLERFSKRIVSEMIEREGTGRAGLKED